MLNQRKFTSMKPTSDFDNSSNNASTLIKAQQELETLQKLLEVSRLREKRLVTKLEGMGVQVNLDLEIQNQTHNMTISSMGEYDHCPLEPKVSFLNSLLDRGLWLIGLLGVQSLSSFVLAANESLLQHHPSIIYFLTMLVGAGGNAGNQAAVRVIRGIALGTVNDKNFKTFLIREIMMALSLSIMLGSVGLLRSFLSPHTSINESLAISIALVIIVFISIVLGSLLPFGLQALRFDPAHSSTTIQVIMDILGVLITCLTATFLLDSSVGILLLNLLLKSSTPVYDSTVPHNIPTTTGISP